MRLKEPLYGLRAGGLHYIMHLSLVIAMIIIEGRPGSESPPPDPHEELVLGHRKVLNRINPNSDYSDLLILIEGGNSTIEDDYFGEDPHDGGDDQHLLSGN